MPDVTDSFPSSLRRWKPAGLVRCGLLALGLALPSARLAQAGTLVQFRTVFGSIDVELLDQDKPITVENFLRYTRSGFYQNIFLHRCVPGFVLQGGEYLTGDKTDTNRFETSRILVFPNFPPIQNEYPVGPTLSNRYGTLAMARAPGLTNSATSQWFFNLADNPGLDDVDGGFTVFGNVVGGTNVLSFFNLLGLNGGIIDMGQWSSDPTLTNLFKTLPVTYFGAAPPRVSDLVYVDITLLNVRILQDTGAAPRIRWNSISGRTNVVEYTDGFPPNWQTLAAGLGNGNTLEVTDTSGPVPARFYRVRVDY